MKKVFLTFASVCLIASVYSCRETEQKADEAADAVEEVIEDATQATEEAADTAADVIEDAADATTDAMETATDAVEKVSTDAKETADKMKKNN